MGVFSPGGGRPPIQITNRFSNGTGAALTISSTAQPLCELVNDGGLTADTYKTILNITSGGGVVCGLGISSVDATSRTISCRVTIDGTEVFEGAAITGGADVGVIVVGGLTLTNVLQPCQGFLWKTSFLVEVKSTLSETDKLAIFYNYYLV